MSKNNKIKIDNDLLEMLESAFDPLTKVSKELINIKDKDKKELVAARDEFLEGQNMIINSYRILLREVL